MKVFLLTAAAALALLALPALPAHADPTQTIVVDSTTKSVIEGAGCTSGNADCTLKVHLGTQPTGNVAVTITASVAGKVVWLPTVGAFNATNYATDKNILILGRSDVDDVDEDLTLTLSTAGADDVVVSVHVTDDD